MAAPSEMPRRPSIPPLFILSICLWASCASTLTVMRTVASTSTSHLFLIGLLVFISALSIGLYRTHSVLLFIAIGLALGVFIGCASATSLHRVSTAFIQQGHLSYIEVDILEDARRTMRGNECLARLTLDNGQPVTVALKLDDDTAVRYGDRLSGTCAPRNPLFETSAYWWNKGVAAVFDVRRSAICEPTGTFGALLHVRNTTIDHLQGQDGEELAVIGALACGWRYQLFDSPLYRAFKTCGLAHLVAVSGAHVVIVVAFIGSVLRTLKASRRVTALVATVTMLAYLILAGCPLSSLRATIMVIVSLSSFLSRRRPSSLNALGICVSLMIAHSPFCALSLSLLLSFASTAGIVLFSPYVKHLIEQAFEFAPALIKEPAALTISAHIVCLPISISAFGQIPLVTLIANIAGAPLFPLACTASLLYGLTCSFAPALSTVALAFAQAPTRVLCALIRTLASAPYASIPAAFPSEFAAVASVAFPFLLWLAWPQLRRQRIRKALALAIVVFVAGIAFTPLIIPTRIVMLNVGQGDAILFQSRGRNVLIDTGNHDLLLKEALARQRVYRIDAVIITHADDDHYGSLEALATAVRIDQIIVSEPLLKSDDPTTAAFIAHISLLADSIVGVNVGDTISFGECSLEINWPYQLVAEGGNEDSLCCTLYADVDGDGASDCEALFTGDAEAEQLHALIETQNIPPIDILKVPHHGSAAGLDSELLAALEPSVALIGVGENNRYGHPKQETLALLDKAGVSVWRTDIHGDITCTIRPDELLVSSQY